MGALIFIWVLASKYVLIGAQIKLKRNLLVTE